MAGFIGAKASIVSNGAERKQTYAITKTTTSLTGLKYTPTKVHVFHNGIRLVDGTDYTATNGTSITLTTAAEDGDEVVVISYATFQTSDTVSAANGGTFAGNVTFSGAFTSQGIDDNGNATAITIDSSENVLIGKTTSNTGNSLGFEARQNGLTNIGRDGDAPLILNRNTSDGDILLLRKDGTTKGQIDVYSNSVDYKTTGDSSGIDLTKDGLVGHGIELYNSSSASLTTTATTFVTSSGAPSELATGPYLLSVKVSGGGWYSETWSGIMQWYAGSTNSNDSSTITMTGAGHAPNGRVLYARFKRFGSNQHNHGLQLWTNSASSNHTIRIYATKLSRQGW